MVLEGRKEVLGLYISENEGANFWLQVLTDLSNRGVNDILIASVDGLKGFPDAIEAIFPDTENQKEFMVYFKLRLYHLYYQGYSLTG